MLTNGPVATTMATTMEHHAGSASRNRPLRSEGHWKLLRTLQLTALLAVAGPATLVAEELSPMDCVINPYRVVDLASPVPGVLDGIFFSRSDYIEEGEIAATLEAGVERASVVLAKARAAVDSEVQVGAVNLDFDKRRKERVEVLSEKISVSVDAREDAQRQESLSRWRLQQANDLKNIRRLELLRAEAQLAQKTIRTPVAGFVLQRFREAGEYVEDQPIMRIAQLNPLYVDAVVPVEHRSRITPGTVARVYPDVTRDAYVDAKVTVVDRVGDAASGTFAVRLTLPNAEYEVMAGVKCMVRFETSGEIAAATVNATRDATDPMFAQR